MTSSNTHLENWLAHILHNSYSFNKRIIGKSEAVECSFYKKY